MRGGEPMIGIGRSRSLISKRSSHAPATLKRVSDLPAKEVKRD
jgi:hypothetical protein